MAARQASRHVIKTSAQLGTMHLTCLFALLSPFPLAASATSSEPLEETDQPCGDSEVCTPLDQCLSHRSKLDSLPKESQEYKEYIGAPYQRGKCSFGKRCHYRHDEQGTNVLPAERRVSPAMKAKYGENIFERYV